jgi:hypothetical protein
MKAPPAVPEALRLRTRYKEMLVFDEGLVIQSCSLSPEDLPESQPKVN